MDESKPLRLETYEAMVRYQRMGSKAVRAAQEESRTLGVPNVYSRNGKIYYELPNGELTEKDPYREG